MDRPFSREMLKTLCLSYLLLRWLLWLVFRWDAQGYSAVHETGFWWFVCFLSEDPFKSDYGFMSRKRPDDRKIVVVEHVHGSEKGRNSTYLPKTTFCTTF